MAGLPYVISGLVAAGGLAAAMSTADGLLLAIANALSHDLYYKIIDPKADTKTRLVVARIMLVVIGAAGAFVASMKLTGILVQLLGLLFRQFRSVLPACPWCLVETSKPCWCYCWYDRWLCRWRLVSVYGSVRWNAPWAGIDGLRFGMIGMPVSLVLMIVVSLMTEEPDADTQKMVEEIRVPSGKTVVQQ